MCKTSYLGESGVGCFLKRKKSKCKTMKTMTLASISSMKLKSTS